MPIEIVECWARKRGKKARKKLSKFVQKIVKNGQFL